MSPEWRAPLTVKPVCGNIVLVGSVKEPRYKECNSSKGAHICQIYRGYSATKTPEEMCEFCVKRSNLLNRYDEKCIEVEVRDSSFKDDNFDVETHYVEFEKIIPESMEIISTYPGEIKNSASKANLIDVTIWLANHGLSLDESMPKKMMTGKERDLLNAINDKFAQNEKKLSPSEVFGLSLKINEGDVYKAMLSAHNLLRGAARGQDVYPGQGMAVQRIPKLFEKLQDIRISKQNSGDWYHLYGTAVHALASDNRGFFTTIKDFFTLTPIKDPSLKNLAVWGGGSFIQLASSTANLINPFHKWITGNSAGGSLLPTLSVLFEEGVISGDLYKDPMETQIDLIGVSWGQKLSSMANSY